MRTKLVVVAVLLALLAATPADAATVRRHYVAATGAYVGIQPFVDSIEAPTGRPASMGVIDFRTPGRSFTLQLDDPANRPGQTLPVFVVTGKGSRWTWTSRCLAVGAVHRFKATPGGAAGVVIASDAYAVGMPRYDLHCSGHATTGTAIVRT